ncbi:sulfite exporter TauE/SafE family protein [Gymnodinialimonas hymeniacidonis]|uniref:sulfite exporter TauE/SafE family protein n=1 Tax=Gymnodinialimonas hymeniacidonis TaxID=3126508 RepID=UPI0034C65EA6
MLAELMSLMPLWTLLVVLGITLLAGLVKGAIGFALPLIIVSGLSLVLDPLLALAGVILPALFSNVLQAGRHPVSEIKDAIREHWRFILMVCVMILIVAQIVVLLPQRAFYLILGVPVIGLSMVQLFGLRLAIPAHRRRVAEWVIGGLAGCTGGITGSWGPPTVLYLMALETPKARQMLVQGVIYSIGAVALVAGHVQSGVLNGVTFWFSALLLIPTFIGMQIGFRIGDRMDGERIRKVILIVLVVAGANLIRRGLMG